jgi:hypothetical protein
MDSYYSSPSKGGSSAGHNQDDLSQGGLLNHNGDPNIMLRQFNPLPSEEVQKKVNYYFMPYSPERNALKHMKFDGPRLHREKKTLAQIN